MNTRRVLVWASFIQGVVLGASIINALWWPSPVTIGLLPPTACAVAYTIFTALREAA